ncbi:galanin receptor 2b-like [Acropora palmata]|uniref:galanin receptor 2b-like n=1 Tax=Acropora palmata TaxID=6131 RepID=UPI003DA10C44
MKEHNTGVDTTRSKLIAYDIALFNVNCIFLALGTIENILICLVLFKAYKVRAPHRPVLKLSNFFLLQLAITDLVFRAVNFFRRLLANRPIELDLFACKIVIFSSFTCAAVNFVLLAGIAVDRYVHILFPIRTLGVKPKKSLITLFIWIYALASCSGFIFSATVSNEPVPAPRHLRRTSSSPRNYTKIDEGDPPPGHCIPGNVSSSTQTIPFSFYFSFAFVVPLLAIIFSYTMIIISLWRKAKAIDLGNKSRARAQLRTMKIFAIIVLSFLFSWAPLMIHDMITSSPKKLGILPVRPLFYCITQTSSIFNPIIYAFGDPNFRRNFRRLFRLGKSNGGNIDHVSPVNVQKVEGVYQFQMTQQNARHINQ